MTTDNLDLSAYSSLNVSLSFITNSMDDSNEDFWLQVSTDGGSTYWEANEWNLNDEFVNGTRYDEVIAITGSFTSTTKLRFRADASGNSDWVYIDDVTIEGITSGSSRILGSTTDVVAETEELEEELNLETEGLAVYPNPASDLIKVTGLNRGERVVIYNMLGNMVLDTTESQINISELNAGIYFISAENKKTIRLMKK